ncbi:MAG: DUF4291 family protein [Bacteroidota bacterium]
MKKIVYADYDEEGVYVYQAFKPSTVEIAVEKGTFGKGFGLDRTSWIKPSFGWVLHRTKYATKNRMQAIARIKITHQSFLQILQNSVEAHWQPNLFETEDQWQTALKKADVVHQWDPERAIDGRPLDRQAIQLGLRAGILKSYVDEFIIKVESATAIAHEMGALRKQRVPQIPNPFNEREYELSEELFRSLGCEN